MSSRKDETRACGYICSEFIHWAFCRTLMRKEYFLFVYHTTSILAKLSTWCFEQSGDISRSPIVDPSHTDEFWEGWNTCLWIYIYIYMYICIYIHIHTHIYWYIHIHTYIYIWIHTYIYSCWFYTKTAISCLIMITYMVFGKQRTVLSYGSQPSKTSCILFGDVFSFSLMMRVKTTSFMLFKEFSCCWPSGDRVFFYCDLSSLHQSSTEWLNSWSENMYVTVLWCTDFYSNILLLLEGSNPK